MENPKKNVQATAQNKLCVKSLDLGDHKARIWRRIAGVIGSLEWDGLSKALVFRTPFSTTLSLAIDATSFGSGKPFAICACRTAARYVLIADTLGRCLPDMPHSNTSTLAAQEMG